MIVIRDYDYATPLITIYIYSSQTPHALLPLMSSLHLSSHPSCVQNFADSRIRVKGRFVKKEDQAAMILSMRLSAMKGEKDIELGSKSKGFEALSANIDDSVYLDTGEGEEMCDSEAGIDQSLVTFTSNSSCSSSNNLEYETDRRLEMIPMSDGADDGHDIKKEEDPEYRSPLNVVVMSALSLTQTGTIPKLS